MDLNAEDAPWEVHAQVEVEAFAAACRRLSTSTPHEHRPLDYLMRSLAGELRDQGFSRKDIRRSLVAALFPSV